MAGHLYWQTANFTITAFVEPHPRRVRVVLAGDFESAGSAVLRGALRRVGALLAPVHLDASAVRALSPDAAAALAECSGLVVDAVARDVAPVLDAVRLPGPHAGCEPLQQTA